MAKVSKQLVHRKAITEKVCSSVNGHRVAMAEALNTLIFGDSPPRALTMEEFVEKLSGRLMASYHESAKLEQELALERGQDAEVREGRDKAAADLRQALIQARGMVEGFWGADAAAKAGLSGGTPLVPQDLVVFANNACAQLGQALAGRKPLVPMAPPEVAELQAMIAGPAEVLQQALLSLGADERETQGVQNRRDKAIATWDKTYIPVANIVEHLFRLADMHAWADQVRPTARRRAGIAEPEDLDALGDDAEIEVVEPVGGEEPAPVAE